MKTRRLLAFVGLLGLMSLAFSPLGQEAPPRPAIRIETNTQSISESIFGYCWPVSADDNQCDFAAVPSPTSTAMVDVGDSITIIIDNSPGVPSRVQVTASSGTNQQAFNLTPAEQMLFDVNLPPGNNLLEVIAEYDNVLGVQAFVSFYFRLNVLPADQGGAEPPIPTQEVFPEVTEEVTEVAQATEPPTEEATPEVPVIVTQEATEVLIPLPVVTEPPTEEPTEVATEEPTEVMTEVATEAPTEVMTEEPTEVPTEEPTEVVTEAPTEEPTEVATEEPTEVATEAPTEVPTEEPTEVATEVPTEEPTEVATEAPTEPPPPGQRPTFTTVPLQPPAGGDGAPPPIVTEPPPPLPTFTPTFTPTITEPTNIPNMQLVFAGRVFDPVGVNFCQRNAAGQRTCVDSPLPSESPSVDVLQNFAIQVRLVDSPRPGTITFTFLDSNSLQAVQSESRRGDQLVLFNINPPPGVYYLRVSVNWGGTDADYFFRVRINP